MEISCIHERRVEKGKEIMRESEREGDRKSSAIENFFFPLMLPGEGPQIF